MAEEFCSVKLVIDAIAARLDGATISTGDGDFFPVAAGDVDFIDLNVYRIVERIELNIYRNGDYEGDPESFIVTVERQP